MDTPGSDNHHRRHLEPAIAELKRSEARMNLTRREFIRRGTGVLGGAALLGTGGLLTACAAEPAAVVAPSALPLIFQAIGAAAGIVGAVPGAIAIADWVNGDSPEQHTGKTVREGFQNDPDQYINETGGVVYGHILSTFFGAASVDGSAGCVAFIRSTELLMILEGKAIDNMSSLAKYLDSNGYSREIIGNTLLPAGVGDFRDTGGSLKHVGDEIRYPALAGDVLLTLLEPSVVRTSVPLPEGRTHFKTEVNKRFPA